MTLHPESDKIWNKSSDLKKLQYTIRSSSVNRSTYYQFPFIIWLLFYLPVIFQLVEVLFYVISPWFYNYTNKKGVFFSKSPKHEHKNMLISSGYFIWFKGILHHPICLLLIGNEWKSSVGNKTTWMNHGHFNFVSVQKVYLKKDCLYLTKIITYYHQLSIITTILTLYRSTTEFWLYYC